MTWLVIADSSNCRFYQYDKKLKKVTLVKQLNHFESKLKGIDLVSDGPGHYKSSGATRGAYSPHETPKEAEFEKFARQIAQELLSSLNSNKYNNLILTAPPHMIGLIHQHLDKNVREAIIHDFNKDYTHIPEHEIFDVVQQEINSSLI